MAARIVQLSDIAGGKKPAEERNLHPVDTEHGAEWIVSTLDDLANYCAYNQLNDVETTLRRALWEASLQLKESTRSIAPLQNMQGN